MTSGSALFLLGDIVRRERGSIRTGPFGTTLKASEYAAVGVPVVSVGEVGHGTFRVHKETRRVGPEVLKRLAVYRLNVGDIVFARKGAVDRSAVVRDGQDGWFLGSDGIRLRLGRGSRQVNPIYLGYALRAADVRRWLLRNATGTTMATLNQDLLERVPVWIPERREQDRIAYALDEVSDLIDALERLSAKKRDVKQGMMQELLTGRTRLLGFNDEWRRRTFGDLLTYRQPTKYLVKDTEYIGSGTPVLTAGKTFILGYTPEDHGIFSDLPVVIFDDFTTDSKYVEFPFKAKSSAMKMLMPKEGTDLRWVYERMQITNFVAVDHKRRWISEYSKIDIDVPTIEEQEAIAAVSIEADAEIEALERRLESARAVKVGMMQELLTGHTRLPVTEEA